MTLVVFLVACTTKIPVASEPLQAALDRDAFNRSAAHSHVPVFWVSDSANPGVIDPNEAVWLWMGGPPQPTDGVVTAVQSPSTHTDDRRQLALRKELDAGRPTLVLTEVSATEQPFVLAMLQVADAIETLHGLQRGTQSIIPAPDGPSQAVFRRNQSERCNTNADPICNASTGPAAVVGVYSAALQTDPGFCQALEATEGLMDPFVAVRSGDDGTVAVPYSEAWPEASHKATEALEQAAALLPPEEEVLAHYLQTAAKAFADNDWEAADRAWQATRDKSAWYVRVAPDETYWEPCNRKAGYHLVFARINPASVQWQQKLEPHKIAMEQALAIKAAPYTPREVAFSLPEFIDIVVNAGDSRNPLGATIGQSLPNWGPVAEAGGRTVAMTNLNNDPDSLQTQRERAKSLFCDVGAYDADPEPLLFSTLLHEAAHNLGPAAGYTVEGKTDEEAFGGELSSMLEELKAQTAALYLTDWLAAKGVVTDAFASQAHMADLVWALGKIADGMTDPSGAALAYPQLSAIQVGLLQEAGAMTWNRDAIASNNTDVGCFTVNHDTLPAAIEGIADRVLSIKGTANVQEAQRLKQTYVVGADPVLFETIRERWQRAPENAFVYGFRFPE